MRVVHDLLTGQSLHILGRHHIYVCSRSSESSAGASQKQRDNKLDILVVSVWLLLLLWSPFALMKIDPHVHYYHLLEEGGRHLIKTVIMMIIVVGRRYLMI